MRDTGHQARRRGVKERGPERQIEPSAPPIRASAKTVSREATVFTGVATRAILPSRNAATHSQCQLVRVIVTKLSTEQPGASGGNSQL